MIVYSKPLEKDVRSDTSGDFRRLLVALMQGDRPETNEVNVDEITKDAQSLINAGSAKFKTDQARFNALFCERSDAQLKGIFNKIAELTGKPFGRIFKQKVFCAGRLSFSLRGNGEERNKWRS